MGMDDDFGPTSHSFVSQRLRLNYLDWGNASAPTLILVHGGRDHARSWDWIARALRRDWHIICPDLRGHGDSAWSPDGAYTMPYYICDLAQLIHQQDAAPVTIVAHSLGGAISLRYAGLYPERVRKLVAIEGLGLSPAAIDQREATGFADRWRGWIEERRGVSARTSTLWLDRRSAGADAFGEQAPLRGTGAPPDDPRRQPQRGWQLQLEVRQLPALVATARHYRCRTACALGTDHVPGHARLWQ